MQPFDLQWEFGCDASVISVAATPNFSTICAVTVGKSVYLLDGSGRPLWDKPYPVDNEAWASAISDDSHLVAVGTASKNPQDGTLYVLTRDRRLVWNTRIRSPIWSVSLSADGQILAASTWDNRLFIFKRQAWGYQQTACTDIPGACGLYGTKLTQNGQLALVAGYDRGLFMVEQNGHTIAQSDIQAGLYNLCIAHNASVAYAGMRDGRFLVVNLGEEIRTRSAKQISQQPICGISASENGFLVACGSFDGRVIATNNEGDVLWDFQTKGEVWSTATSADGSLVCAAGGDHKVRFFQTCCNSAAYQEIVALERSLAASSSATALTSLNALISLYLKYHLAGYGYARLTELLQKHPESHIFKDELRKFLESVVALGHHNAQSHFHLGVLLADEKKYMEAIRHFQMAARNPGLRSSAQRRSAECFAELRLDTAATSAWRQSREQHLDDDSRHILFTLARSYEGSGEWREAAKIYEMVISWDADFRNSWDKLEIARSFRTNSPINREQASKDYTGNTTSLLGPDATREVDEPLRSVLEARSREMLIRRGDREAVEETVVDLLADKDFSRGIKRDIEQLEYDVQLFVKYDFGLPEDEMKKFLETVNALPHIKRRSDLASMQRSLDIGSATGRYPTLLHRLGFQAYGIDIEKQAIEYSIRKRGASAEWPRFICGDARHLDDHLDHGLYFDVITCMMGTFDHIPRTDQAALVNKIRGRLVPSGIAIISVWDVECPHLAYLSIYDEVQKELIRQNSRTRDEMQELFRGAGFSDVLIVPFCLIPQTIIYDLGIARMQAADINIAAQADLAAKALFNGRHGEMFLTVGING